MMKERFKPGYSFPIEHMEGGVQMPAENNTIRELAELFGVTSETLRYYERLGLLNPKREKSGNRLYSHEDFQTFKITREWLQIGCSLKEISDMYENMSIEEHQSELVEKLNETEKQIIFLQRRKKGIEQRLEWAKRCARDKNHFDIDHSPELLWWRYAKETMIDPEAMESKYREQWMQEFPHAMDFFRLTGFPTAKTDQATDLCGQRDWGMALSPEEAEQAGVSNDPHAMRIPSQRSFHGIITDEGGRLVPAVMKMCELARQSGHAIVGAPCGYRLLRTFHHREHCHYFEVWIPIE